jgi:hypothetical protein
MAREAPGEPPINAEDYGQADYATDFGYDPAGPAGSTEPHKSWIERAGDFFSPNRAPAADAAVEPPRRRRGPSDRVLWAVIVERLEDERRLDVRDVEVVVENAEVTLNGTVRHKDDRRRVEDVADIRGVKHVQNNLRVR